MKCFRLLLICALFFCCNTFAYANDIVEPPQEIPNTPLNIENQQQINSADIPKINAEVLANLQENPLALLPYTEYHIDREAKLNIRSASDKAITASFLPYQPLSIPNTQGLVWLRISFEPIQKPTSPENSTVVNKEKYLLNLGNNVQGITKAWFKENGVFENIQNTSSLALQLKEGSSSVYLLENIEKGGELYIAIEGLPSLWFAPLLEIDKAPLSQETFFQSITVEKIKLALLTIIGLFSLLCFVRAFKEKTEWRFWSGAFGLFALATSYLGIPATPAGAVIPSDLLPIFALAATLFSLVLVGRYCMALLYFAKGMDFLFLLMSILGIVSALIPFLSNYSYLVRYIELWQLLTLFLIFPTVLLMFKGIKASARYFLVLFILFISCAISLLGIGGSTSSAVWALSSDIGLLLALFILFASPKIVYQSRTKSNTRKGSRQEEDFSIHSEDTIEHEENEVSKSSTISFASNKSVQATILEEKVILPNSSTQKDTPLSNAKLEVNVEQANSNISPAEIPLTSEKAPESKKAEIYFDNVDFNSPQTFAKIEQALRIPLDSFMQEVYFIEQQLEAMNNDEHKNAIKEHMQRLLGIGKDISAISHSLPRLVKSIPMQTKLKVSFNLQDVLKQVYEKVRYEATSSQVALSWFCSPHLGVWYVGDKDALASLLYQLLSDAIRATNKGLVYLHVKRDEASNNYGRLKFVIGDSGDGQPPHSRSASLLSKVWEITSNHHGEFKVEKTESGMEYSFILAFIALENDGITEKRLAHTEVSVSNQEEVTRDPKILIVVAEESEERYLLSFKLEKMPCHVLEAMNLEDCYKQYTKEPSGVILLDSKLNEGEIAEFIAKIRKFEGEENLPHCIIVALTRDRFHDDYLKRIGCDYTLDENIRRVTFREEIEKYLNQVSNPEFLTADVGKTKTFVQGINLLKENEQKPILRLQFGEEDEEEVTNIYAEPDTNIKEEDNFYPNYNKVIELPTTNGKNIETKIENELNLTQEMVTYETLPEENFDIETEKKENNRITVGSITVSDFEIRDKF